MDDLLGLNEINTNTNSHSNCYFEEEDKKEELYIKMIEDRIMFKIRKEIIEPLISDFNVETPPLNLVYWLLMIFCISSGNDVLYEILPS